MALGSVGARTSASEAVASSEVVIMVVGSLDSEEAARTSAWAVEVEMMD